MGPIEVASWDTTRPDVQNTRIERCENYEDLFWCQEPHSGTDESFAWISSICDGNTVRIQPGTTSAASIQVTIDVDSTGQLLAAQAGAVIRDRDGVPVDGGQISLQEPIVGDCARGWIRIERGNGYAQGYFRTQECDP